jgi:hypothetical protein
MMKTALFALSVVLQLFALSLSSNDPLTRIITESCLLCAVAVSVLGIVKYKSKLAYLPLFTGGYLLFFFYHMFHAA